jgi:hypothetical protein
MKIKRLAICIAAFAVSASAQTVTGSGSSGTVPVFTGTSTVGNSAISVSGGNVGIGTTAPPFLLTVAPGGAGSGFGVGWNRNTDVGETDFYNYGQDGAGGFQFWNYSMSGTSYPLSGAVSLMTLAASGNVGIGTMAPGASLQIGSPPMTGGVFGAFSPVLQTFSPTVLNSTAGTDLSLASIGLGVNPNNVALGIHGFRASNGSGWTTTAIGLGMDVDNTTRAGASIWLHANGDVGIGTTTPGAKLEVDGSVKLTSGSGASITFADGTVQSTAYTGVTCGGDYAESVDCGQVMSQAMCLSLGRTADRM